MVASSAASPNAFDVLKARGFVQQVTDEAAVRDLFAKGQVTAYVGYDPTADSLHVGHLLSLMALAHLKNCGHRPIAVVGGGTARVGDPSGKTEMRKMLSGDDIDKNARKLEAQIDRFLDIRGKKALMVDNAEWLLDLRYVDFLRDIGVHFSVNRMLSAEAYKLRLERGLSFIEFNYQLLQAYDFLELRRRYDCRLQMGGDDQWGNILAGVELNRRVDSQTVEGLTSPLLMTATGEKMGKTAAGAVWLDPGRLDAFAYYQYWVNTHDDDVVRMLGFFTFLPMPEIQALAGVRGHELNIAKSVLAYEATKIVHGAEKAAQAHLGALAGFGGRTLPKDVLPASDVPRQASGDQSLVPSTTLTKAQVAAAPTVLELMLSAGLVESKGEARRMIDQGGVKLNDEKVSDQLRKIGQADFRDGAFTLRAGKKKLHRFVLGS